jgi:SAM-dependent methyltransferase
MTDDSDDFGAKIVKRRRTTESGRRRSPAPKMDGAAREDSDTLPGNAPVLGAAAAEVESHFEDLSIAPVQPSLAPDSDAVMVDVDLEQSDEPTLPSTVDPQPSDAPLESEDTQRWFRRSDGAPMLTESDRAGARDSDSDALTNPRIPLSSLGLGAAPSDALASAVPAPSVVIARAQFIVGPSGVESDATVEVASRSHPPPPIKPRLPIPGTGSTVPKPPPVTSVSPRPKASPAPAPSVEDHGLHLVEVEDSTHPPSRSRTPPPPPPDPRAKPVVKRPPPPPSISKPEEERPKRYKARQWWERFFSDDYLITIPTLTPAQVGSQVDFIESSLGLSKGASILDVGCGLGLHAIELTRRGYLVVGIDLSLAMITRAAESAQHQKLRVNFLHADFREMPFDGSFDAVICMGTTFGFFDDDENSEMIKGLHHALKPGGRLLIDIVNRDYLLKAQPNLVWFQGNSCVCMEESEINYFTSRLIVKRTMMRDDGRQSQADYSVRVYSLHEFGKLMQQAGFRVLEVSGQEALRGVFFGANSPRILTLAERRQPGRASTVMPSDRTTGESGRASGHPAERASGDMPKPSRRES